MLISSTYRTLEGAVCALERLPRVLPAVQQAIAVRLVETYASATNPNVTLLRLMLPSARRVYEAYRAGVLPNERAYRRAIADADALWAARDLANQQAACRAAIFISSLPTCFRFAALAMGDGAGNPERAIAALNAAARDVLSRRDQRGRAVVQQPGLLAETAKVIDLSYVELRNSALPRKQNRRDLTSRIAAGAAL